MKSKVAISLLLVTLGFSSAVAGDVAVTDGDGLVMASERIRLWGIDAPELDQTCKRHGATYACGENARDTLAGLLTGGEVSCEPVDRDRYGRLIARCSVQGRDLGAEMVRRGWAVDFRRYSRGAYAREEDQARAARRGLWAGEFVPPAEWRRKH